MARDQTSRAAPPTQPLSFPSRVKDTKERVRALAMSETDKKSVTFNIAQFLHPSRPYDVLIISYEVGDGGRGGGG